MIPPPPKSDAPLDGFLHSFHLRPGILELLLGMDQVGNVRGTSVVVL